MNPLSERTTRDDDDLDDVTSDWISETSRSSSKAAESCGSRLNCAGGSSSSTRSAQLFCCSARLASRCEARSANFIALVQRHGMPFILLSATTGCAPAEVCRCPELSRTHCQSVIEPAITRNTKPSVSYQFVTTYRDMKPHCTFFFVKKFRS